jgi:hypothetical protein
VSKDKDKIPDDIQKLLGSIRDVFDLEDQSSRQQQIRVWRKLKFYWNNITKIYFSEVAHDWRIPDNTVNEQLDQSFYDKPMNVFRALLESIIAALSVTVPSIQCAPDDADNPLDLSTAKAGNKIAELVFKHNNAPLLWIHALYIYCTEGLIAAYAYPKEDEKYGTTEEEEYENIEDTVTRNICPVCQEQISDEALARKEMDEFMPDDDDAVLHNMINNGKIPCANCSSLVDPELRTETLLVRRLVGITKKAKTRQCIEVYGGLNVKVPNYARTQEEVPVLRYSYELHYSEAIEKYPHLREKIGGKTKLNSGGSGANDFYERWGRLSTQYGAEYPVNTVTINSHWMRPCSFNVLGTKEETDQLKKLYPDGCKVVWVNDLFATAENESLDDCWTLTKNPLSDYLHHDPLGSLLVSVQDITNDIVSLTLQTMEHGIPQTFADPGVVNFKQYNQTEAAPGMIYPTKPISGKKVSDGFYEVKTASLSAEVLPFAQKILETGQMVSGALPSLFGGAAPNSSKTAAQYSMSRAQALQRLQTQWKMLTMWWKDIFGKVIPMYIKMMQDDEKFTEKDEMGNFVNVFIRKAETQGKIGSIELEGSEQLPVTWAQKKDVLMQLMQAGNPEIMAALLSPENIPLIKLAVGMDDFVIPGEDDRQKQYEEIQLLLATEPIIMPGEIDPMTGIMGPEQELPSVDVDPTVDNNGIEADICRRWAVGDAGRQAKQENPKGYKNVLLHLKRHSDLLQAMQAMATMQGAPGQPQPNQPGQVDTSKNGNQGKTSGNDVPGAAPLKGQGNANRAEGTIQ